MAKRMSKKGAGFGAIVGRYETLSGLDSSHVQSLSRCPCRPTRPSLTRCSAFSRRTRRACERPPRTRPSPLGSGCRTRTRPSYSRAANSPRSRTATAGRTTASSARVCRRAPPSGRGGSRRRASPSCRPIRTLCPRTRSPRSRTSPRRTRPWSGAIAWGRSAPTRPGLLIATPPMRRDTRSARRSSTCSGGI